MNLDNKQQLKEMYTLVIVDEQNDFGSKEPKGALYVKGGEKTIDPICELIEKYHNKIHSNSKMIPLYTYEIFVMNIHKTLFAILVLVQLFYH